MPIIAGLNGAVRSPFNPPDRGRGRGIRTKGERTANSNQCGVGRKFHEASIGVHRRLWKKQDPQYRGGMEAHQKAKRSFSKMRTSVLYIASVFLLMVSLSPLQAQEYHRFNFGAGAGVSVPTSDASANLNTGWNINVRGGVNV